MEIGKLEKVPLRDIWKNEAKDFTQWLANNIEVLGDKLGMKLSIVQTEKEVGMFSADLLTEDDNGDNVVIECQLEKTDHDHLGKLVTYYAGLNAKKAIWICKDPSPEHVKAVTWLNESTLEGNSFYLVTVEGVRIGDSPAAALFQIVSSPSKAGKEIGKKKGELATRHIQRREFWEQLLEKSKVKTRLFSNVSPSIDNWIAAGAGTSGLTYNYTINMGEAYVELYIDRGKESEYINQKIFDSLKAGRDAIEKAFLGSLDWGSVEGRRSKSIGVRVSDVGLRDSEKWDEIQDSMIDAMIRLEKALKPHIMKLES